MSELINNLNAIYNTKLQIKAALRTDSDDFSQYPSYIAALGPAVSGYSYITSNGDFDISSYAMVNVNVPQGGGGVDYQWVDMGTNHVLTQGDKISFNGVLGSGEEVTQDIINVYQEFEPYLGWYMYPVSGWDRSTSGTTPWEKYVLSENQLSISQNSGVVVSGEIVDIQMGSAQKITILEDIKETKYAGGNGTKDITTNGTQQVIGYKSVNVNVQATAVLDSLNVTTNGTYTPSGIDGWNEVIVNVPQGGGSGTVLSNPTISYTETAGGLYCNIHHNDGDFTVVEYISPEALGPNILDGFNVGPFNTPYTVDVYNMAFNGMNQPGYSRFIVTRNEPDWSQGTCFFCDIDADPSDSSNRTYLTNFSYNFGTLDVDQTITKKFYLEYNNINYAIGNWYSLNIHESTSPASDNYTIGQFDGHFEFSNTGENTVPGYNLTITFDVVNKLFTITWQAW